MSVMSSARHNNVVQADDTTGHVRRIFRAGFALVPCGHARFCEASAMRVSDMACGMSCLSYGRYHGNAHFLLDDCTEVPRRRLA